MTEAPVAEQQLPLFYRAPEPVSSQRHADWRLRAGDYAFAADSAYVPVVVGEFAALSRHYPILFANGDATAPVALLGLEHTNMLVTDGAWDEHLHIPAYVRRYPFGYAATGEPDRFALIVDSAAERVVREGSEGAPLFENGEPSALTRQALAFCEAFRLESAATEAFCAALQAKGLLIERRADITTPDGAKFGVNGFSVVDANAFAALDAGTIVEWHAKGWLALVHFHLASLEHFQALLARKLVRAAA